MIPEVVPGSAWRFARGSAWRFTRGGGPFAPLAAARVAHPQRLAVEIIPCWSWYASEAGCCPAGSTRARSLPGRGSAPQPKAVRSASLVSGSRRSGCSRLPQVRVIAGQMCTTRFGRRSVASPVSLLEPALRVPRGCASAPRASPPSFRRVHCPGGSSACGRWGQDRALSRGSLPSCHRTRSPCIPVRPRVAPAARAWRRRAPSEDESAPPLETSTRLYSAVCDEHQQLPRYLT